MTIQEPNRFRGIESQTTNPSLPDQPRGDDSQLIHELANLLDGCLRNISLVMAELKRSTTPSPQTPTIDQQSLLPRLQTANQAMGQMILLIERSRDLSPISPRDLHDQPRTLGQVVQLAARLLLPQDSAGRVQITVDLPQTVCDLLAGPIYPVVANAMRNSIEAILGATSDKTADGLIHKIRLVGRIDGDTVELNIEDTGPGLASCVTDESGQVIFGRSTKPTGSGVGLTLSRDIVHSLDGQLEIYNKPTGGTCFSIRYPAKNITQDNPDPIQT